MSKDEDKNNFEKRTRDIVKAMYSTDKIRSQKQQKPDTLIKATLNDINSGKMCLLGCFKLLSFEDRQIIHDKKLFAQNEFDLAFYKRIAIQILSFEERKDVICYIPVNTKDWLTELSKGRLDNINKIQKMFKVRSLFRAQERQMLLG